MFKLKLTLWGVMVFWGLSFVNTGLYAEPLKIAYTENGKPWAWEEEGKRKGILIEIADEALAVRMGIHISHNFLPWKRAQKYVERGDMDALITNHTKARKRYTVAGDELVTNIKRSIFMVKGNPLIPEVSNITSLTQLKKYKMGNYSGNSWAEKNLNGYDVFWTYSSQSVLYMLANNRFDIYVGNPVATKYKLKVLNITNIIMLANSLDGIKPSQFKLIIRKKSPYVSILGDFDTTLRTMKEEGVVDAIFNKYQ